MTDMYRKAAHQLTYTLMSYFAVHGSVIPEPYNQQIHAVRIAMAIEESREPLLALANTIAKEWYDSARTGNPEDDRILRMAFAILTQDRKEGE